MADVTLTLTWDAAAGKAGGYRVTLPDGRAFEPGDRFAWTSKEAAEEAVRDHFGYLRQWIHLADIEQLALLLPEWAVKHGQSLDDVHADLRLIGIDPATGVEVAAEAEATPPQKQEDDSRLRGAIAHRLEDLEDRRRALAVEMLEVQGAIEALRGRAMMGEALWSVSQAVAATEPGGGE